MLKKRRNKCRQGRVGGKIGGICDKREAANIKRKVYKTVVRPTMLFVLETEALTKRQEAELEMAQI